MGIAKSGALGGSEGQVKAERHQPLGRAAAATVHCARNRRQARGAAPGRAGLGSRPDIHGPHRGARARVEERLYDRDRHPQHAAGSARIGLHGVYVSRRNGGIRRDRRGFHQAEEERDGRLHHRTVRLTRSGDMGSEHLSKQYDSDLETLRSGVLQMGGLVEAQIRGAIDAFATGDQSLIDQVIANEPRVNGCEVSIDNDCSHIIVKRQPAASDLRLIMAISKTVTDLERIGDEAEKVARMSRQIHESGHADLQRFANIRHAADIALSMLHQALDAFARLDAADAASIIRQDVAIDTEFRSILRQLITFMMEDPRTISTALEIVWIAKAIERIGDHAKNIAENVIYIVKGTDVRHTTADVLEREALS